MTALPARFRLLFGLFLPSPALPALPGGSLDGGRCEFREFSPSFAMSVTTWLASAATCSSTPPLLLEFADPDVLAAISALAVRDLGKHHVQIRRWCKRCGIDISRSYVNGLFMSLSYRQREQAHSQQLGASQFLGPKRELDQLEQGWTGVDGVDHK